MNWFFTAFLIALIPTVLAVIGVNVVWKLVGTERHDEAQTSRLR